MNVEIDNLKAILRKQMRAQRKLITGMEREQLEIILLEQSKPLLRAASQVAIYHAAGSEISLTSIIQYCVTQQIRLYQPITYKTSREMCFEQIRDVNACQSLFYPGDYQLLNETKCYNLDLVFVPLLAVDRNGYRLGQGGGYYDTTFANRDTGTVLCGVGFECQLIDQVPHDAWDLQLDYFISEKQLIEFR